MEVDFSDYYIVVYIKEGPYKLDGTHTYMAAMTEVRQIAKEGTFVPTKSSSSGARPAAHFITPAVITNMSIWRDTSNGS